MLTVTVLCVGKLKEQYLKDGCAEYLKRLGAFCKINIVEVDEARLPEAPSQAQIDAGMEDEGRRMEQRVPNGAFVVAMCIEGGQMPSQRLAAELSRLAVGGVSSIAFIIGGSHGIAPRLKARAGLRLSMSEMTFPHQLARLMLLEQIYRAFQIESGGKYHK